MLPNDVYLATLNGLLKTSIEANYIYQLLLALSSEVSRKSDRAFSTRRGGLFNDFSLYSDQHLVAMRPIEVHLKAFFLGLYSDALCLISDVAM